MPGIINEGILCRENAFSMKILQKLGGIIWSQALKRAFAVANVIIVAESLPPPSNNLQLVVCEICRSHGVDGDRKEKPDG
jgi:hypothetical protein